jgi:hypothetical protein
MRRRGAEPWARDMFITATVTLATLDLPLKERLRAAYKQNIYPLFVAREEALNEEECLKLEDIFVVFLNNIEYLERPGEGQVEKMLEKMPGEKAEDLAAKITHLAFKVCDRIPPEPSES